MWFLYNSNVCVTFNCSRSNSELSGVVYKVTDKDITVSFKDMIDTVSNLF